MITNLEKYKSDLDKLIKEGDMLYYAIQCTFQTEKFTSQLKRVLKDDKKVKDFIKKLPRFTNDYQTWYSEALALVRQLLPDRLSDFISLYEKSKTRRKDLTFENYVIEDALQGLNVTRGYEKEKVVGADAAIPRFAQQLNIVKAIQKRFESSLFDIRQLVQADLFDSELASARELNKKGFVRGAGAIAGVVLEGHLLQVCANHKATVRKKNPGINDLAQLLKDNNVIDTPVWRNIQRLADLRNLCDHKKTAEPKQEDIEELIDGVAKISKTLF